MSGTRKLVIGGVVAAAAMLLMAACVLFAGLAHASSEGDRDASAYAAELAIAGLPAPAYSAQRLAGTICERRSEGISESAAIAYMEAPPPPIASHHQAMAIVMGAEWHFCPAYYQGGASGGYGGGYA